MKIQSLLARMKTEEEFVAEHPGCALLIARRRDAAPATRFDTLCADDDTDDKGSTQFLNRNALRALQNPVFDGLSPDARVAWLVKSNRNPFSEFLSVGRAGNNDVVVRTSSVSKVHALLHHTGDWFVQDRGSKNGTFVDGVALEDQEKRALNDRCRLRFGPDVMARFFTSRSLWALCQTLLGANPTRSS